MNRGEVHRSIPQSWRTLRKSMREMKARIAGKGFHCEALAGESCYNICINSDMTVSCSCCDHDGEGHIGDLREQTIEEVLDSPKANSLRSTLAAGKLPLLACASCRELRVLPRRRARELSHSFRPPKRGLTVENTSKCCYQCINCHRRLVLKTRRQTTLGLDDARRVASMLADLGVQTLQWSNMGEPFAARHICEQLQAIRAENPDIHINIATNGMLIDTDDKRRAAMSANHIVVSIYGIDDESMNRYQRGADFERVYRNLKALVAFRDETGADQPTIEWEYVLFNWNDRRRQVQTAIRLAKESGVNCMSLRPALAPLYGMSWRYYLHPFYRRLGKKSWKGREIVFRRELGASAPSYSET